MGDSVRVYSFSLGLAQAYLIESRSGLVLVDAGSPGCETKVTRLVRDLNKGDLRLIYITHAHLDHYGSAGALQRLTGALVVVHRADSRAMALGETHLGQARGRGRLLKPLFPLLEPLFKPEPVLADILVDDGDVLSTYGLDATVVHTPGHTPGSSCLFVDGRYAFVGDLISTTGNPHVQRAYASNWSLISSSLGRLQALKPEIVYPGHGRRLLDASGLQRVVAEYNRRKI
jgi:hydroxyacylglutathione hydrolase